MPRLTSLQDATGLLNEFDLCAEAFFYRGRSWVFLDILRHHLAASSEVALTGPMRGEEHSVASPEVGIDI